VSLANVKTTHSRCDIALLLALISVLLVLFEVGTRAFAIPASRIESTIDSERLLFESAVSPQNSVLIVGNSLTQAGVQAEQLNGLVGGVPQIYRYAIAQTVYFDWRYGLAPILANDRAPATLLLLLSPEQFASKGGRGDYSALRLIHLGELLPYMGALDMHPTDMSKLVLSHFSAYYGFRNELRKNVIGRLVPGVPALMQGLNARAAVSAPVDTALLRRRFSDLRSLSVKNRRQLLVGVPPLLDQEANTELTCSIARSEGLRCLMPRQFSSYSMADFSDGFHLSASGSAKFMAELAKQLKELPR